MAQTLQQLQDAAKAANAAVVKAQADAAAVQKAKDTPRAPEVVLCRHPGEHRRTHRQPARSPPAYHRVQGRDETESAT